MPAVQHLQELAQDTFIDLFEVSGYNPDSPFDKFRFTNHVGIQFGNKGYQPIPAQVDSIEFTSDGTQPEPTLSVGDPNGIITGLILLYDNMEGASVRITRTQKRYLDGQPEADPTAIIAHADFLIARREQHIPREVVVFVLANPIDIDGAKTPARICLRNCVWRYRDPDTCGYSGEARYTLGNQRTLDPKQDKCSKSIAACKLRFGENAVLRYGGFPGLQRRS
ncbi:MAG: phage minor tail protein L [Cyanobacteria bacterium P01_H01_bin.105]